MVIFQRIARFIAAWVFGSVLLACSSEHEMRSQILEKTPIGSGFDQVLEYCSKSNLKCFQSNKSGYLNQDTGEVVGVKSIWAVIDEYEEAPLKIATTAAYWGFDSDNTLIDIWVWNTIDAP